MPGVRDVARRAHRNAAQKARADSRKTCPIASLDPRGVRGMSLAAAALLSNRHEKRSSSMAETTRDDKAQDGADVAAALRDRGMEQIEGAKGQLAEGAERVAAAVERTADDLEGDGDNAISGFGRSVASLMRQLAGGLRERDVAEFAGELAQLARRNPGVFLAGSV